MSDTLWKKYLKMIAKKKHKLDDNKRTDYETMTLSLHYMVNWKEKKKYTGV